MRSGWSVPGGKELSEVVAASLAGHNSWIPACAGMTWCRACRGAKPLCVIHYPPRSKIRPRRNGGQRGLISCFHKAMAVGFVLLYPTYCLVQQDAAGVWGVTRSLSFAPKNGGQGVELLLTRSASGGWGSESVRVPSAARRASAAA